MSFFKRNVERTPEIIAAMHQLEHMHPASHIMYGKQPYHYVETSKKGKYKRFHFYKGMDKRMIYIVLSPKERSEIEKNFKEKIGDVRYVYRDTIYSKILGDVVQHRFEISSFGGNSRAYMTDDGVIGHGQMVKDD